ncbi:MAG: TetR/AcrR family transcriptional regulator [Deltaproteobacteria bacterium]|nr:TetR/AcrR family transcriptional regulator [Deltaproteobacteria bacterium]MBW2420819.1 TetR/AcrR family transcriptional regulator [Deltaproteobacteria bacterium]
MTRSSKQKAETPTRRSPRQSRSRELVKAVREAGRLLLAERGPEGLTMARIAERAGVSVGSLYQYFENKDAILRAIHEDVAEEGRDSVQVLADSLRDMDPKKRIRVGIEYAAQRHRKMLELAPEYYREHHKEFRIGGALPDVSEESREMGQQAVFLARQLLRAEEVELGERVQVDYAAFLLGRGISAILRAALEDSPELLQDPGFIDEVVLMMARYIYPD